MTFLRKILVATGLILVLALLRIFFQKYLPGPLIFHFNFFSCLQLIVMSWAVITGLLETLSRKYFTHRKSFLAFLLFLLLAESGSYWMLHHPASIPRPFLPVSKYYYANYERNVLQFDPNIAQYDTGLFYRMKSNNHTLFSNIEFADSIYTDALGFRDNTHALDHPSIICLGDSYTLGWGVRQAEAYPSLLEATLGLPVLNTGMSSYGTAREMASIEKVDKSSLRTVVIQYCYNDAGENDAWLHHDRRSFISPPFAYDSARKVLRWSQVWFPCKYSFTQLKIFLFKDLPVPAGKKSPVPINEDTAPDNRQAAWFLEILKNSDLNFDSLNVFVFDIGEYTQLSGNFIDALEKKLADPAAKATFKGHIHTLHVEKLLTPDDYYILDDHIRPSGHRKLAKLLVDSIRNYER